MSFHTYQEPGVAESALLGDQNHPDIVYNATTGLWSCCGELNNQVACNSPTDQTFQAPAPLDLSPYAVSASRLQSTSASTSATESTQPPAPTSGAAIPATSSAPPGGSSGLSPGAKAGISIGIILGVACVVLAGYLLALRRRRSGERSAPGHAAATLLRPPALDVHTSPQELSTQSRTYELDGQAYKRELGVEEKPVG